MIISRSWRVATILAALFLSTTLLVGSFFIPLSTNRYRTTNLCKHELRNVILQSLQNKRVRLNGAQMLEFDFEDEDDSDPNDTRTDEEKGLSHGYEGEFKIGDVVKVRIIDIDFPENLQHHYIKIFGQRTNDFSYGGSCSNVNPLLCKYLTASFLPP